MEPHVTCYDHPHPAQVDAYTLAAQRGLFSTDTLPPPLAQELARYEQAILHLRAASHSLQWPLYTDLAFAHAQHHYCEESIGEILQTVRDLLEQQGPARRSSAAPQTVF